MCIGTILQAKQIVFAISSCCLQEGKGTKFQGEHLRVYMSYLILCSHLEKK